MDFCSIMRRFLLDKNLTKLFRWSDVLKYYLTCRGDGSVNFSPALLHHLEIEMKIHDNTKQKTRVIRSEDKSLKNHKRPINPISAV